MNFLLLFLAFISTADATVCADGWVSSSTGRGTCSHHGGIASGVVVGLTYDIHKSSHDKTDLTLLESCPINSFNIFYTAALSNSYIGRHPPKECNGHKITIYAPSDLSRLIDLLNKKSWNRFDDHCRPVDVANATYDANYICNFLLNYPSKYSNVDNEYTFFVKAEKFYSESEPTKDEDAIPCMRPKTREDVIAD
jgi:hypothetical protein